MQSTQKTIEEVFDATLAFAGTNAEAWSELLDEDVVMESPFAAVGTPKRLEGKPAVYNYVKEGMTQISNMTFTNVHKYLTTDPNVMWAEYHGEAIVHATGRRYQQDYVTRLEIRNGKIVYFGDYFNPNATMYAFGTSDTPG